MHSHRRQCVVVITALRQRRQRSRAGMEILWNPVYDNETVSVVRVFGCDHAVISMGTTDSYAHRVSECDE